MKFKIRLPKLNFYKFRKIFFVAILSLGLFSAGYVLGVKGFRAEIIKNSKVTVFREMPPGKENLDFSLFWKVWDTLNLRYFDKTKLNQVKMVYGAIEGMVAALGDPYTSFLPPSENKVVEEDLSGNFEGVGIQIGYKGTQLAVVAPLSGSPAEKAGIMAGDYIVGVKDDVKDIDRSTAGLSLPEAVQIIRGKAGTNITLLLMREGNGQEPFQVEVQRAKINVPSVLLSYVDEGRVAHISLLKFGGETEKEWQKAVKEILAEKEVGAIVLDLRNNPGGYLEEAVNIASEFVKTGTTIVIEEKGDGTRRNFDTQRIGLLGNTPLVILVNGGSASASEILAGALRDIKKVKIVGEKSFGKGTIQEPQTLDGGSGLHITIAKWLTPLGTWVHGEGLTPDVEIKNDAATPQDEQLDKAIELLGAN